MRSLVALLRRVVLMQRWVAWLLVDWLLVDWLLVDWLLVNWLLVDWLLVACLLVVAWLLLVAWILRQVALIHTTLTHSSYTIYGLCFFFNFSYIFARTLLPFGNLTAPSLDCTICGKTSHSINRQQKKL